MLRTISFDCLEGRKLLSTTDPNWDPVTGWNPVPAEPGTMDPTALDGAYTTPLYQAPPLPVVYPFAPATYDILHTHTDIIIAP